MASFNAKDLFADLKISDRTKRAIKYTYLSKPQSKYMSTVLSGADVLIKARTGSGKTLGFLIPVIEDILRSPRATGIKALILSPSRELAIQTHTVAVELLKFHEGRICAQSVTGGTKAAAERKRLTSSPCDILVATPGRLKDHVENLPGFASAMQRVHVVVLDEADRLLDSGFLRDIKVILGALNPHHRTLLFTATVPEGVAEIAKAYMRPDFVYVDTTIGASPSPRTKVIHEYAVVPPSHIFATLAHAVVKHRRSDTAHKIIVFFNTAWMAHFAAKLFQSLGMHDVMETHSRLSQSQRNAVAAKFAQGRGVVIFASDVIARGIDFPDVTFVVQVGLTDPTQYEHRIGRTGRAGKTGRGLLIIGDDEKVILEKLGKFSMKEMPGSAPGLAVKTLDKELNNAANKAFSASLGFYAANTRVLKWTPQALVNAVKARFASMGLPKPDPIPANRLAKMHLKGAGLE